MIIGEFDGGQPHVSAEAGVPRLGVVSAVRFLVGSAG